MSVLEPDVSKWTPEAVAAFLASPAAEGLTAADLQLYVAMRSACRAWESSRPPFAYWTKKAREDSAAAYQRFRQARARWSAVLTRLHPPIPITYDVQTLSTGGTHGQR